MCGEAIRLWTLQVPGFDLTSGRIDHAKSEYYRSLPGAKKAYHELWERLESPDGQIVWCYTDNGNIAKTGIAMTMWELRLPRNRVICFLDSLVWNRILRRQCAVGTAMRRQWIREAIKNCPATSREYVEQREKEFWEQQPKTGSWWDELFVQSVGECVDAIIPHPVPDRYVQSRKMWCCT